MNKSSVVDKIIFVFALTILAPYYLCMGFGLFFYGVAQLTVRTCLFPIYLWRGRNPYNNLSKQIKRKYNQIKDALI